MNNITCDDAFEILTAPGRPEDPRLTAHLQTCSRCQTMADTLAPALDLFRSVEPSPPGMTFTGQQVAASEESSKVSNRKLASKVARRLTRQAALSSSTPIRPIPPGQDRRTSRAWWGAAAVVLAFAVISLKPASETGLPGSGLQTCPRHSEATTEWMQQHHLPVNQACLACHPPLKPSSALPASTAAQAILLTGLFSCSGY